MTPEERLAELGITLPDAPPPAAAYVPWVRSGSLVYTAGQVPVRDGQRLFAGKVGGDVDLETGQAAARACAVNVLAQLRAAAGGELSAYRRIVKLTVFVASTPDFHEQHLVANGASTFLGEVMGDAGPHARSAVGVAVLPLDVPVEIEAVAELA